MLTETDDAAGTANDSFTVYQYGPGNTGTEQTNKTVYAGLDNTGAVLEDDSYSYNLQGEMSEVVTDLTGSDGAVTTTDYAYDDDGNRVSQTVSEGTMTTVTSYLIDENNFTGYSQTLEETVRDSSGTVTSHTTYVIGLDVIGQYVAAGQTTQGAIYLKDGHGSVRGLYDATSTTGALRNAAQVTAGRDWTKILSYDAYGNAMDFDAATSTTELFYNTEYYSANTGLQYLRSRSYSTAEGRFVTLDSYCGDAHSPRTLNGYSYAYSSPIDFRDPSGRAGLGGIGGWFSDVLYPHPTLGGVGQISFFAGNVGGFALGMWTVLSSVAFTGTAIAGGAGVGVGGLGAALSRVAYAMSSSDIQLFLRRAGLFMMFGGLPFAAGVTVGYVEGIGAGLGMWYIMHSNDHN
jgi:RHS repeat-associated protein